MEIETYEDALLLMHSFINNSYPNNTPYGMELNYTLPVLSKKVFDEVIANHDLEEFVFASLEEMKTNIPKTIVIKYEGIKFTVTHQ